MSMVLNSCLEVASHLEGHYQRLIAINDVKYSSGLVLKSIKNYMTDIKIHEQSLAMIKQSLEGTEKLVSRTIFIPSLPKKVSSLANSSSFVAIVERHTHFPQRSNPPFGEPNDLQKCRSRVYHRRGYPTREQRCNDPGSADATRLENAQGDDDDSTFFPSCFSACGEFSLYLIQSFMLDPSFFSPASGLENNIDGRQSSTLILFHWSKIRARCWARLTIQSLRSFGYML